MAKALERSMSQKQRDALPDSDFAWPEEQKYPIPDQAHLDAAVKLLGHAPTDKQASIKARIKAIAKRKGLSLPESWKGDDGSSDIKDRSMDVVSPPSADEQDVNQATSTPQALTPQDFSLYLPITRTDATQRRVFGQATIEQPDAYGTIFGFYPEAWKKWRGNIREQHDPKKAVGKALEVLPDEQRRAIDVDLKVSRGAQDTWLKVEDGVLTGLSASIIPDPEYGNDIRNWPKKEYNGKQYPYLPRYSVVELSLVDNPATPGCNIQIVRAQDGESLATDVLDTSEPAEPITPETPVVQPQERAGASISAANRTKLHAMRDSAMQMCADNGCDECAGMMSKGDDGDGDNDTAERMLAVLERSLAPVYSRQQQFLAQLARANSDYTTIREQLAALTATVERLANSNQPSSLERVLADLSAVKVEVEKIAAQPMPGGPILNGARPVEKTLATDPYRAPRDNAQDVLTRMQQLGALDTIDKQVAAAALAAQPVRGPYSR